MGAYVYRRPWKTWRRDKPKSTFVLPPAPPPTVNPDTVAHGRFPVMSYAREKKSVFRRPWWAWGYARTTGVFIKNTGNATGATTLGGRAGFGATATVTRRSAATLAEADALTATAIKTNAAASTLAERDGVSGSGRDTALAATTLSERDSVGATARETELAAATLAERDAISSPGSATERATIPAQGSREGVSGNGVETARPSATLSERAGQTDAFGPITMRAASSPGVNARTSATARHSDQAATTISERSGQTANSSPAGVPTLVLSALRPGRRVRGKQKGYTFRRPWWNWGGAQSRSTTIFNFIPPTTLRANANALNENVGETASAQSTRPATVAPQGTAESFVNPTATANKKPAATIGERSGQSVTTVRVTERPAATLGVRETAAELPAEGENATATLGARLGLSGSGKRTTAATIARNFGAVGDIFSAGNGGTWRALILPQPIAAAFKNVVGNATLRAAKNFNDLRAGLRASATQIYNGAATLRSNSAVIVNAAKIAVIYCYTFISARGEAVSGSGATSKIAATSLRSSEAIAGSGKRTTAATVAPLDTMETANGSTRKTIRVTAAIAAKASAIVTSVVERRVIVSIIAELDQISIALVNRIERGAAFITGVASIFGSGKKTTAATSQAFDTKEAETGSGAKTARSTAAPFATIESEAASAKINATPRASIGVNARIPTATFRVTLTASVNLIANAVLRSPGKIATAARSVVGSLLGWFGFPTPPVIELEPGETLKNDHPRVRSLAGQRAQRSLRLDHKRNRSLP